MARFSRATGQRRGETWSREEDRGTRQWQGVVEQKLRMKGGSRLASRARLGIIMLEGGVEEGNWTAARRDVE